MILKRKKVHRNKVKMTKSQYKKRRLDTSQRTKKGEKKQLIHQLISKEVKSKNEIDPRRDLEATSRWQFPLQMHKLWSFRESIKNKACKKKHNLHKFKGKKFQRRPIHNVNIIVQRSFNQPFSVQTQTIQLRVNHSKNCRKII